MSNPSDLIDEARLLELTETLVSIPSVANNEHEISGWIYDHFRSLGLEGVVRLPVEESGDTIAGWLEGPLDGPTLMFNFHMDTFDAFESWETEPFKPTRKGDRLYGVGTHDMKGGAACLLGVVEALVESGVELGPSSSPGWSWGAGSWSPPPPTRRTGPEGPTQ